MSKEFLGEYKVIRKVGEGGMAEVFLAHHKDVPDHRVILKRLKDPSLGKSFRKEANNLAKLNEHQNICTIFHFFTDDDKTIIVMQYIEGATLKDIIESEKKLPVSVVLKLAVDLLRIISYAHERKIYHRDIKPGNIMVDKQGDLKVIDFGIAKDEADPEQTAAGIFSGTPLFAPLEQFNPLAKIDWPRADVYAIGTTLYLMVSGKLPFRGRNWSEIAESKRVAVPPAPSSLAPETPEEFDRIILKAISRDPEDRYANAGEMLKDVEALRINNIVEPVNLEDTINIDKLTRAFDDETVDSQKFAPTAEHSKTDQEKSKIVQVVSGKRWSLISLAFIVIIIAIAGIYYMTRNTLDNDLSETLSKIENADSTVTENLNDVALTPKNDKEEFAEPRSAVDPADEQSAATVLEGKIRVTIEPSGNIYLDNKLVASDISKYVLNSSAGSHTLKIENNHESIDSVIFDSFKLRADQTLSLSYTFIEKPLFGGLIVGTLPVGASVYINGELQSNETPFTFSLKPGEYIVRLFLESPPIDRETTLVVIAGDTLRFIARSVD
ncbi:MAG: serine/threonine protein kinase [candidate division Zixibacteria bacterium]|nr:serine/threonine protein kinase [candidate division Zixibacteria bacterium]